MSIGPPYSIIVPFSSGKIDPETNRGSIHRSPHTHLAGQTALNGYLNLFEVFRATALQHPRRPCLGHRPIDESGTAGRFLFKSYKECYDNILDIAAGLQHEHLLTGQTLNVSDPAQNHLSIENTAIKYKLLGLYMKNCPEWVLCEYACYASLASTVPLYHTIDMPSLQFIVSHTQMNAIVTSVDGLMSLCDLKMGGHHSNKGISNGRDSIPSLTTVILAIPALHLLSTKQRARADAAKFHLYTLTDIMKIGRAYPCNIQIPQSSDLATFCYTSGTTGVPKGALISHANITAVSNSALNSVFGDLNYSDYYLSFLPLPHIFERMVLTTLLSVGAAIGFAQGDPLKIIEDTVSLEPTIYCAVPRLLNKIHDKIMLSTIDPPPDPSGGPPKEPMGAAMKRYLLKTAIEVKLQNLKHHNSLKHTLWDMLLFSKIKTALGMKNVRRMVSGGAPLSSSTMDFLRILLGEKTIIHEGYGLTETTGGLSVTASDDLSPSGHVGSVLSCCEVSLGDVPDMEYMHSDAMHDGGARGIIRCDGRGEILVRGPGVFHGYFRNAQATAEAFTTMETGKWFRTGDIGLFQSNGQLMIIDRKKNLLKLSQGEYVALEKVENVLSKSLYINQLFVYGKSTESVLVGVVIPDTEAIKSLSFSSSADLKAALLKELDTLGRSNALHGFELLKNIHIEEGVTEWGPHNGFLTPTMKLKRTAFTTHYGDVLDSLYAELKGGKGKGLRSRL